MDAYTTYNVLVLAALVAGSAVAAGIAWWATR